MKKTNMSHEEIYNNFKEALFNASEKVKKDVLGNPRNNDEYEFLHGDVCHCSHLKKHHICTELEGCFVSPCHICGYRAYSKNELLENKINSPITLEDIILALSKKADNYKGKEDPNGIYWLGAMILNIISSYKLGVPASEQSDETLIELTKLLE